MRKTQDKHRNRAIGERQSTEYHLGSDVVLQHDVQLTGQGLHGGIVLFWRHKTDDLVRKIFAVAEKEDCQDRDRQDSRNGRRRKPAYFFYRPLNSGPMLLQKRSNPTRLRIAPTNVASQLVRNFSRRDFVAQRRDFVQETCKIPVELWRNSVKYQCDH